ncbi:MAG: hypothetical protein PHI85_10770 [Victivallaceae bacterium]|nr:hypothetical protein [Victivallaceae bacterium]
MNNLLTNFLAIVLSAGCLTASAGRIDASFNAEGGGPGFGGGVSYEDSRVFAGKYSYSATLPKSGELVLTSTPIVAGGPVDSLFFSGFFTVYGGAAAVSAEFQLLDRYGHVFEPTHAMPIPGSGTKLAVSANPGDRVVSVERSANWTASPDVVVVFSAPDDGRDLPNLNCAAPGIAAVTDTGYAKEIKLNAPLTGTYTAGPVRLHRLAPMEKAADGAKLMEDDFRQIVGKSDCGVPAAYVRLKLTFRGAPGAKVVFDDVAMADAPVAMVPVSGPVQSRPGAQRKVMDFYADQGYELDRVYGETGMKLDTAAMRTERDAATAASGVEMWKKSDGLRERYLKLSEQLEALIKTNSLLDGEVFAQRKTVWELEFAAFKADCAALNGAAAEAVKAVPAAARAVRDAIPPDYLFTRFILGMDLAYKFYGEDRLKHPGNAYNPEYIALAFNRAGINLVSLEVIRNRDWRKFVGTLNDSLSGPMLAWSTDPAFDGGDSNSYSYFGNIAALEADAKKYLSEFSGFDRIAGLQLDEPVAVDSNAYGVFYRNRAVMNDWSSYAQSLNAGLARANIKNVEVSPRRPELERGDDGLIPYFAWQLFKKEYMGRHLSDVYKALTSGGNLVSTVLIDWNSSAPQATSFVSSASQLPYVGTDLYYNGGVCESFSMQLLRSAAADRAIMWPGAGYSCKDASAFARSLAVGVAYGDGLHVWTYEYCSKYRDPNIFWRYGAENINLDDRNRLMAGNWSPDLWSTVEQYYSSVASAGSRLAAARPESGIAVLFSERQAIMSDNPLEYYNRQVGLYSTAVAGNVPCAVEFLECLTPEKLTKYKVLLVSNLEIMSKDDATMLRNFVGAGGVLVTFGEIATRNEWGIPVRGGALAGLLGVRFDGVGISGCGSCETPFGTVSADRNTPVLNLNVSSSVKRYLWDTFGVAMTENRVGKGVCYSFALPSGGMLGYDYVFYPGLDRFIANLAAKYAPSPVVIEGLPAYVEVAVKRNDRNELIVVLINRTGMSDTPVPVISGHRIRLASGKPFESIWMPGGSAANQKAADLPGFNDSQMIFINP